ncbi:carbohydrate-binding domain-containing protein [Pyxidicoccus sp. 3LFB2]
MRASPLRSWCRALAVLALSTAGCTGQVSMDVQSGVPDYDNPNPPPPPVQQDGTLPCDLDSVPSNVTLQSIALDFAREVHPAMVRESSGCISCHATTSGRLFKVSYEGVETFYAARAAGFMNPESGSLLSRLVTPDEAVRMPRGQPSWSAKEIAAVASLTCQLAAVEARQPAARPDEEFPQALLQPYTGPTVATYDNPFIGFDQLKGKVKSVFNDPWVRNGADRFAQNVGLFGGVDYKDHFVEARAASADFLLGLDDLARDVCLKAATEKTGPFTGLDLAQPLLDIPAPTTKQYEMEAAARTDAAIPAGTQILASTGGRSGTTGWNLYTTGSLTTAQPYPFPTNATYRFTVKAKGDLCGPDFPHLQLKVDGVIIKEWDVSNGTAYADFVHAQAVTAGDHVLSVHFTNDYGESGVCDRNMHVDALQVYGPTETSTGTQRADAAKAKVDTLYRRMLYRAANTQERTNGYALVKDLNGIEANLTKAWSGLCEGLMRAPDFLFTLPPSYEGLSGKERDRLLLVKLAQDLLGRPPTAAEFTALESGQKTWEAMVDTYLESPDFRTYYYQRMRIRTESEGTPDTDEPARLWTHLVLEGKPLTELLTGDYSVDPTFKQVPRAPEHGKTGVLTMKGFIKNKPGLPHYNYAARVMTDFMGAMYEVPSEVFDMRGAATAASTVDPTSICFACHQTLTPLAHQRLKWDDEGNYRTTDQDGKPLDDSDRGLVGIYAYKGQGMEAFATQAVKKEAFVRRTLNAQYALFFGREMRHSQDERVIYKRLWDVTQSNNGNLKAVLKAVATSPEYQRR